MKVIDDFREEYDFLSNFYICRIEFEGRRYMHTEGMFQAFKVHDEKEKDKMSELSPSQAKKYGKKVPLRKDWEQVKDECMYKCLVEKFTQHKDLGQKLLDTGDALLVEGNTWGDRYWGVCRGKGENHLGILLMMVREDLREGRI